MPEVIGFIGLGIMGGPMAQNLLKNNVRLLVYDLAASAVSRLTAVGAEKGSLAEIGKECNFIITMLPNGKIVRSLLFGEDGLSKYLSRGTLVCDMSSISPQEAIFCEELLDRQGVGFMDAPVSGGEPKAINGTLTIMAGASPENFERAEPYFKMLGEAYIHMGGVGSGSTAKLCNQIITTMNIAVVAEALSLAAKAGIGAELLYRALRGGSAYSRMMETKIPKIINRDFEPGGRVSTHLKDIKNVIDTGEKMSIPLPLTKELFRILQEHNDYGCDAEDSSSLVKYYERLSQVIIK